MDVSQMLCPSCGAPPALAGPVPGADGRRAEGVMLVVWTCGHRAIVAESPEAAAAVTGETPPAEPAAEAETEATYRYREPSAETPFPFSPHEYARLLVLRSRVQEGAFAEDGVPALH